MCISWDQNFLVSEHHSLYLLQTCSVKAKVKVLPVTLSSSLYRCSGATQKMHSLARYRSNPKGPFCVGGLDLGDADLPAAC